MADIFDQYAMADAWDEMFDRPGEPRPAYQSLFAALQPLSVADLRSRADQLARVFTDRGVTFAYAGEERPVPARPDPADPRRGRVGHHHPGGAAAGAGPGARSWPTSTGPARCSPTASCPGGWSSPAPHFHREAAGIEPANGVRVHVSGVDLIRDEDGEFRVLEDNLRIPSGVSYVIENRRALSQTLPEPVRRGPGAPGRRLPGPAARGAAGGGAGRRRPTRASSCSPPASTTPPTSSTPCWPG